MTNLVAAAEAEWVSVSRAALIANRRPRTVYDWISQGRIASKRVDGALLVMSRTAYRLGQELTRGRPKLSRT